MVLDLNKVKNQHAYWNCYCMYCNRNSVINSQIIQRGSGRCKKCTKRVFTYMESLSIAKDYVNGDKLTYLMKKYNASDTAIYSALKLIKESHV